MSLHANHFPVPNLLMSICLNLRHQSYHIARHHHYICLSLPDRALCVITSKCSCLSSPAWNHCTVSSRFSYSSFCVRHVSLDLKRNRPPSFLGRRFSSARAPLTKRSTRISVKRLKWGLLDPELRRTIDTLHQDLGQSLDKRDHEILQSNDSPNGPGDQVAELDSIPLSPLMDREIQQARRRHREPKSPPRRERTEFQSLLAKNPYGIIRVS